MSSRVVTPARAIKPAAKATPKPKAKSLNTVPVHKSTYYRKSHAAVYAVLLFEMTGIFQPLVFGEDSPDLTHGNRAPTKRCLPQLGYLTASRSTSSRMASESTWGCPVQP